MILRRIRGLMGIATTWGIAFSAIATTLLVGGLVTGIIPGAVFGIRGVIGVAIRNFIIGGVAGMIFSMFFARGARRQTLETLSMPRVALWGFLGVGVPAAALTIGASILYGVPVLVAPVGVALAGAMGSAMSLATVKLARRAPALPEYTE